MEHVTPSAGSLVLTKHLQNRFGVVAARLQVGWFRVGMVFSCSQVY